MSAAAGGSVRAVGRLLTTVESGGREARAVSAAVADKSNAATVIGLTGPPGVGKSTLTTALVRRARAAGRRVAVLAVDPSSPFSGGALLGDRVRMAEHATDPGVFIRSLSSRGRLGGVSAATPAAVGLMSALGFDLVIVETVGVGQNEVEVMALADTVVVVLAPGMGDGIQAAKAGILEVADVLVVNKADREGSAATVRELTAMVALGRSGRATPGTGGCPSFGASHSKGPAWTRSAPPWTGTATTSCTRGRSSSGPAAGPDRAARSILADRFAAELARRPPEGMVGPGDDAGPPQDPWAMADTWWEAVRSAPLQ